MNSELINQLPEALRTKVAHALFLKDEQIWGLEAEVLRFKEMLRLFFMKKYGPSSEQMSDAQLLLLELEPGVKPEEVEAEAGLPPEVKNATPSPEAAPKKSPVRKPLPANLQREELGVSVAPVPASIIEKGIFSDRLVVDVTIKKYLEHLPLYRQALSIQRDADLEVSQSTLCSSMMKVGELLSPVTQAMGKDLLAGNYIQADETPVPVQSPGTKGKNHRGYLWEYGRPFGPVIYEFRMGREREGPLQFLKGYNGRLQTDGYAAYIGVGGIGMLHFGCWSHARRKFYDASQLDPKDVRSAGIVLKIGELYGVEKTARESCLSESEREALRKEMSLPILEELKSMIVQARAAVSVLPKSALGRACDYTLSRWDQLKRYATEGHGITEIDNNWAYAARGISPVMPPPNLCRVAA